MWCNASGAKFNINKTSFLPIGNAKYRESVLTSHKMHPDQDPISPDIEIVPDMSPVRILGAFVGNKIDQMSVWIPILDKIDNDLEHWNRSHPTINGCRLIVNMVVGGHTQYLSQVQGMPQAITETLKQTIQKFIWNSEIMAWDQKRGGHKVMNIEARNDAIILMKLKSYLNFDSDHPTWAFFADDILRKNISPKFGAADPKTLISSFLQS